eukprot:gene21583-27621_t
MIQSYDIVLHVQDEESEADASAKLINEKLNLKVGATIPSLLLRNLSDNVTIESLKSSLGPFNPQTIKLTGGLTIDTSTIKLGNNRFTVQAYNIPSGTSQEEAERNILKAMPDSIEVHSMLATPAAPKTVMVRLSADNSEQLSAITEALSKINVGGAAVSVSEANLDLRRPAIVIRNIKGFTDEQSLLNLFVGRKTDNVQVVRESRDRIDSVVAYFGDEKEALTTLQDLKDVNLNGKKLNVVFRELVEPVVTVSNLPANVTESELHTLFAAFNVGKIVIHAGDAASSATVSLSSTKEATLAVDSLNRKAVQDKKVVLKASNVSDIGLTLNVPSGANLDEQAIIDALQSVGVTAKSFSHDSNKNAFIGFLNATQAVGAQNSVLKGLSDSSSSSGRGGVLSSTVSAAPSFVLQVLGLSPETPSSAVAAAIQSSDVKCVKLDRTALVKFKGASTVIEGLKSLKAVKVDDKTLKVRRYAPLTASGSSEYDVDDQHLISTIDKYSLKTMLKDYLYTDPATRYQIAQNMFERTLQDAKARPDMQRILDASATAPMKAEVAQLLKVVSDSEQDSTEGVNATQRLFELYLQREDMRRFSSDFKEIEAFLGPANVNDPFDWTQFRMNTEDETSRLKAQVKVAETARAEKVLEALYGPEGKQSWKKDKELLIKGEDGEPDVRVSLEDPNKLRGRDGTVWSGVILDEDTVQKVTPGQRLITFRVLVVVGNMRGACGFGMGKGATGADALNNAFRAALRELVHLDLFDNFGLAHDCHGKHNSCQAYIRATPRARDFVGSQFAYEILTRFGVGSASVKLNGRRDPYAMVNAIFNAIVKHENIDEFSKDRGKRYLSLKWAYDNSV